MKSTHSPGVVTLQEPTPKNVPLMITTIAVQLSAAMTCAITRMRPPFLANTPCVIHACTQTTHMSMIPVSPILKTSLPSDAMLQGGALRLDSGHHVREKITNCLRLVLHAYNQCHGSI